MNHNRFNRLNIFRDRLLELHSNKAKKIDVLNQLRNAWDRPEEKTENEWQRQSEDLLNLRNSLNQLVDRLHRRHPNGLTPYHAIGMKVRDEELAAKVSLSWSSVGQHDEPNLNRMRKAVEDLAIQARAVGSVTSDAFRLVCSGNWSPQWESEIVGRTTRLAAVALEAEKARDNFCEAVGINVAGFTTERLDALVELARVLQDSYRKETAFALESDGADKIEALRRAVVHLKAYISAQADLSCPYDIEAWRVLDGRDIARRWKIANDSWWPKSVLAKHKIIQEMKAGGAKGKPRPEWDADTLTTLREEGSAIDRLDQNLFGLRGWHKHATDPQEAETMELLGRRAIETVGRLTDNARAMIEIRTSVRSTMREGNDLLAPEAVVGRASSSLVLAFNAFKHAVSNFEAIAGSDVRKSFREADQALEVIQQAAETIATQRNELNAWCAWRRARDAAIDSDLKPLVDAIEEDRLAPDEIEEAFEAAYCSWWSGAVISEDEVLRSFSVPKHVSTIRKFRELDDRFRATTSAYVNAKLRSALPSQQDASRGSEWGILQRELQRKRGHKPVRQLINEIPAALTKLTPCLMMSPLSIAQYLSPNQGLFDVVIFDEASQITVWDAVGAIARGRQVVVAGDPKQMPPTNFFGRSEDDPDGIIDAEGDLESILDEMLGASIPHYKLNWHYRSRRESLIAFSNHRYYDGSLITFPAPAVNDSGVRLVKVDGKYARGGARHNEIEAKAVAEECVRRLLNPDPKIRKQSVGIVTFNAEQQSLIENLLDAERARNPQIEWAFSSDSVTEPVFVKNLETVQGDERDIILFSITFGPDLSGHITMNFGPLNRDGGGTALECRADPREIGNARVL